MGFKVECGLDRLMQGTYELEDLMQNSWRLIRQKFSESEYQTLVNSDFVSIKSGQFTMIQIKQWFDQLSITIFRGLRIRLPPLFVKNFDILNKTCFR